MPSPTEMPEQIPRLTYSELTGHVFVATEFTEIDDHTIVAITKHDVTDQFVRIETERRFGMNDEVASGRDAALEDLEHVLTFALQAMADNDACADPDDPDWRAPAIAQFRRDLRSLGVADDELDSHGIKP